MSSINPVVVLPGALAEGDVAALATAYVGSLTLGAGQFCTNPGLLFLPRRRRRRRVPRRGWRAPWPRPRAATMLTAGIAEAYATGTAALRDADGVRRRGPGQRRRRARTRAAGRASPTTLAAPVTDEVFGASGVVVRYDGVDDLLAAPGVARGPAHRDRARHRRPTPTTPPRLLPVLELKAGRILFNGWPTGVEVGHAMVHGGPFPATSDSRSTSVGTLAIERFLRPVAYQNLPEVPAPGAVRSGTTRGT